MSEKETPVEKASAAESSCSSAHATDKLALAFASILCRLWLGARALQTGIEKFSGSKAMNAEVEAGGQATGLYAGTSEKAYSLDFYHGVPASLMAQFEKEPLMIGFFLKAFDKLLGPALILLGISVLLGIGSRISLLAQGLLYTGLTWGLILIKQDSGVAWLGTHIILVVMALGLIKHDRLVILKKW